MGIETFETKVKNWCKNLFCKKTWMFTNKNSESTVNVCENPLCMNKECPNRNFDLNEEHFGHTTLKTCLICNRHFFKEEKILFPNNEVLIPYRASRGSNTDKTTNPTVELKESELLCHPDCPSPYQCALKRISENKTIAVISGDKFKAKEENTQTHTDENTENKSTSTHEKERRDDLNFKDEKDKNNSNILTKTTNMEQLDELNSQTKHEKNDNKITQTSENKITTATSTNEESNLTFMNVKNEPPQSYDNQTTEATSPNDAENNKELNFKHEESRIENTEMSENKKATTTSTKKIEDLENLDFEVEDIY